jgi:ribosome-associated protein
MKNLEREIVLEYIRSSGPGGQNVNKVATTVQLRFDIVRSSTLREDIKERLVKLAGRRVTDNGILIIEAHRFRTQENNREDAIQRFNELVRKAIEKPKTRRKTHPTKSSKEERLIEKKKRSEIKKFRHEKKGPFE